MVDVGKFYGHLVNFKAIQLFYGNLVYFSRFVMPH
jgi:hypothetical protein